MKSFNMSKISISVEKPCNNIEAAKLLHKSIGIPLVSAKKKLEKGKTGVFYTTELFLNDHKQKDKEIRAIISGLEALAIKPFIMEIAYDESWSDVDDMDKVRISVQELMNTLDDSKDDFA